MAHEIDVQLPLQFEDFYVLSFGDIIATPSYCGVNYIWPIGYKSCWHEKVTASLFTCEVSDNGHGGPVFMLRRSSCSTSPIPSGSTVLSRADQDKNTVSMDSIYLEHDEYNDIVKTLPDINPSSQMDLGGNSDEFPAMRTSDNLVSGDFIGEILAQDSSPYSAWKQMLNKVAAAYKKTIEQRGGIQCFCEHVEDSRFLSSLRFICPSSRDKVVFLDKFASQHDVKGTFFVEGYKEASEFSESLINQLRDYRCGLDIGLVQEIIEQLPGAGSCSGYVLSKDRLNDSALTFVNNKIKIKDEIDGVKGIKGDAQLSTLTISSKMERMLITEETPIIKPPFPLGSLISSRLSSYSVGNLIQVHEFFCRFQEILGVEDEVSFEELEKELICPWKDSLDSQEEVSREKLHDFSSTDATYMETIEMNCTKCMGDKLATVHQALLPELVTQLVDKIGSVVNITSEAEVSKLKGGHKKDTTNRKMAKRIKLDMIPINQLTWPEVVRRYVLSYLLMGGRLDLLETSTRNNTKLIRCLLGDGGICCCSLTAVAGVDADAKLLGRAVDKVFNKFNGERYTRTMGLTGTKAESSDENGLATTGIVPEWAKVLDEVRNLPTNVGARIRNLIYVALKKNPPYWAEEQLRASISKDVYKGNASGPTKRAVIGVLNRLLDEAARPLPSEKEEKRTPELISKLVLKKCRIILRDVAASDVNRVFTDLVGKNFSSEDDDIRFVFGSTLIRPLDLRTIDLRLLHGAYRASHEAFLEDVRELWVNLKIIHSNNSGLVKLADEMSKEFESRYENEVTSQLGQFLNGKFTPKELEDQLTLLQIPKAPWETGICKRCGLNRDDETVLLCDNCNAEYHTYCLSPPLSTIPQGDWYCPSCAPCKQPVDNVSEGQLRNLPFVNKKWEEADEFLDIASAMEETEYWDLEADKKTFLLKLLCDDLLDTALIRDDLDKSQPKLAKKMQKPKFDIRGRNYGPAPGVVDHSDTDKENDKDFISNDHLKRQLSRPSLRKEFLGIDSDARFYWGFPETSPHHGIVVNENSGHPHPESSGSWQLFKSDDQINNLIDHLKRNDPERIELRDSILQWQQSMAQNGQQNRDLVNSESKKSIFSNSLASKATVLLELKYGLHSEPDADISLKKPRKKNVSKWHRCDCLEPVLPSWYHCDKCHETFFTYIEFELHKRLICGQSSSSELNQSDVGKISENNDGLSTVVAEKAGIDGLERLVSGSDPFSEVGGEFVILEGALKPIVGKAVYILRQLKINLLDMEAALPDGAKRSSRGGSEWRSAWCRFVKSASTIYEMVQAIMVFETMIKTEYIKNTWWWYWSSATIAAKTSTLYALALRIYTLDAAIDYQKTATSFVPKPSKKRKEASENANKSEDKNKKSKAS